MEQTKNRWALKVVLAVVFVFAMTLALTLGIIPGVSVTAHAEETQTRPEDGVWHDQQIDRSAIQVGDVFYADKTSIHIFNDMHTTIQAGDHEEVVDWKIALREDGIVTEHYEIPWDGEIVVPFGKVYTYQGTVFDVTNVSGTLFTSGTCIARLDNGVLTVGSKTGNDASMDDHEAGNRAEWCIQPFNGYITKVVVLDKVTWIGDYAFWNLPNLKEVEIASSVSVIGNYAFSGSGLETIVIPDTVTSLYSHIFDGCSKLKNVTLPKGANAGDGFFANCGSITDLSIFDGVNRFGSGAFSGCSGLVDVTMPNSVTAIGNSCFSGCGNLKRLVFSDNIKKVPNSVCNGCGNLEEVVIGSGVTYIDNFAFSGCNKLEKAFFNRPSEPNDGVTFAGVIDPQYPVGLPFESCTKLYYTGEPEYMGLFWGEWFEEEGVYLKDIQKLYAYVNDKLVPAKLPWLNKNEVTKDYSGDCEVVRNWKGVATVRLRTDGGEGNDHSGRMADGFCNWEVGPQHMETRGVIIEDGVTHIGAESFSHNYIEFVTLGADVESIGNFAFGNNPTAEITFNSKLKTIGYQAFYENYNLKEVCFPDSVTNIGGQAFCKCFSLKTAVMPKNLEVLGGGAFEECGNLKGVMTFPKTVTTIGNRAFSGAGVSEVNLEKYDKDFNPEYNGLRGMTVHMYGTGNAKLFRLSTGTEIIDGGNMGSPGIVTAEYIWRVPADYESGDCLIHFDGMYVTVKKNPNTNGNGEMADYANLEDRPWHNRIQDIIAIDFEEGVTRIGDRVFKGTGDHKKFDIKYINLPETGLKTIGDEALQGYLGVEMRFASSVTHIGNNAIGGKYFRQAIFICPDERSTLTLGENAFVDGLFGFERTGSMILYDDEDRVEGEWLENHTNRTLIWRDELYRVANRLYDEESDWYYYDEFYNVKVNDRDTLNAGVGDLVTVTLTPLTPASFEDREIKTVSVVKRKKPISSIQEFIELIGDNEIVGDDNMVVKVIDGRIVLVKDNEIIYKITDDYSLTYYPSGNSFRYYLSSPGHSDKPTWDFNFGMLSLDVLYVRCDGFKFEGYGNVTTKERDVEVTKVSENVYSFTMPDGWAILYATEGKPLPPPAINRLSNDCELFFTNSENKEINQAKPGEMVTITIDADPNYIFEKIFAYVPYNSVTGISQIATLMGKAIFEGVFEEEINADFSGLYCKVNENGNFVVMNGNEIVAELVNGTMTNDEDHEMLFTTFTDDENIWSFIFESGILRSIIVQNKENEEYIFGAMGEADGILGQEIELTEIEKGIEYTFVMPDAEIFVVANYIKTCNINIEETENGNITTTIDGNDVNNAKQNDTITITIEPEQGYELKELSVLTRDANVKNIEQLKAAMGNAVFTSEDTTTTCKIGENGNFVLIRDGNVIAEITEISGFGSRTDPMQTFSVAYIDSNGYDWTFEIRNGILVHIQVSNIFKAYGEGAGKLEASEEKIPLTTVIKGQKYTFVMPGLDANIVATFEERNVPEHDHNETTLELVAGKEATCETAGNIAYYRCTVCGELFSDVNGQNAISAESVVIPAKGHDYKFDSFVWNGFTAKAKYVCSHDNSHIELRDATVANEVTTAATCEGKGVRTYTATYDGHTATKTEEIAALGHDLVHHEGKAATCTEIGWEAYDTCSRCDYTTYVEIKALGHDWGEWTQTTKPSCTEKGIETRVCSHDETHVDTRDVEALGHKQSEAVRENEVLATCETAGSYDEVVYCSVCGEELSREHKDIDALGHDWGEWRIITEPTNEEEGLERRVCSRDETHVDERAIPVHSHNETTLELVTAKDATCETAGNIAYYVCKECGKVFKDGNGQEQITLDSTVVPAKGHSYGKVAYVWSADNKTCTATRICAHDASHIESETVNATAQITQQATCTLPELTTYTATFENAAFATQTKANVQSANALGHAYGEVTYVWSADNMTCTATRTCAHNASHVETETVNATAQITQQATCELPELTTYTVTFENTAFATQTKANVQTANVLGHDYQDVVTAPTCTERGYTTHTCSRCDDHYVDTYVDALGHQFGEWTVTTAPTCTGKGVETRVCEHDETHVETRDVDALGHNFGDWVVTKEAEVGVKGEETRTCSLCGETEARDIAALPYVPTTNDDGEKVYSETLTEEAKDVTELFAQAKEEEGTVEVKADELVIVFDSNAVNAIGDSDVSLSAKITTENLTVENAELVIEVTLTGATFADGSATVSVPFAQEVPAGKVAKVYYIADDGTRTDMNATFENGKVSFVTNHFSTYAVVFEDAAVANTGLSGGAIAGIVIGSVFGALLIACAVLFLLNKKGVVKLGKKD